MNQIYAVAGVSKQGHHQFLKRQHNKDILIDKLRSSIELIREDHPGCGLEKIYRGIKPDGIGRDKFISIFKSMGYGVKKKRNFHRTTIPVHVSFPNLISGMRVDNAYQIWQSDITYFEVNGRFYYLSFIIDVYSKVIKGYYVSDNLKAESNIKALKMALKNSPDSLNGLIHHSDRGSQFVDKGYQKILSDNGILISMGIQAQDNAYAERINGTIKNEYLKYRTIDSFEDLKKHTRQAVNHYNNKRPHNHLPNMTPNNFEKKYVHLKNSDRPSLIIYAKENFNLSPLDFIPRQVSLAYECPINLNSFK